MIILLMWYNINFTKWAVSLLPPERMKPKFIAFIKVLVSPIADLHYSFLQRKEMDEFITSHNGQVCYLRKALNELFDPDLERIRIGNSNQFNKDFIYTRAEQKPKYLGTIFLKNRSDFKNSGIHFIVYVPKDILSLKQIELESWINKFKKGVKKYKIIGE
ncbi:hypothetical protein [Tenacibaculum maritimum]|uniref:hypothetical protein n=1 Tax=Tenacibaculum maritimum TaxID=107401 RepID=UPI001331054D|nr:hypothetical protein [Tenacibaculum maritimum]